MTTIDDYGNVTDGNVRYSRMEDHPRYPNVLQSRSVSYFRDGAWRSSWGWRLECKVCRAVSQCSVGSSVACEDAPGHFARDHIHPISAELEEEIRKAELAHRIAGYKVDNLKRQRSQAI